MLITIISWCAVAAVLLVYLTGRMRMFDWVNVCACIPIALPAILAGAYSSGSISLAFGCIGGIHIIRTHQNRKKPHG
jgi:hypothetical protein